MSLEVITGCMYSGKSEELVRRLVRARIAGLTVQAFKPAIDDRYHPTDIATHIGGTFEAMPITSADEMIRTIVQRRVHVVGFDEAQFMDPELLAALDQFAARYRIIVAGLDLDYRGVPFGPIPALMAMAENVTKLSAVCVARTADGGVCGEPATRSYRVPMADSGHRIQVGSTGVYEARCRSCWAPT